MKLKVITSLVISTFILASYAFQESDDSPVDQIANTYQIGLSSFADEAKSFQSVVQSMASKEEIQSAYAELRNAYKRIEFLVFYADAEWATNFLNGAPLPHLEPKTSGIVVLEPEGLQRIEELVFEDDIDFNTLKEKAHTLVSNAERFTQFSVYHHFSEREIFEATRFELVRILTQGITGFDTPASNRAIVESEIAMRSTMEAMLLFKDALIRRNEAFASEYFQLWNDAVHYLGAHPEFDDFNRAHFTRTYIEPLFGMTLDAQAELFIEFKDETTAMVQSVNPRARHIFASDFINPFYFTMIREHEMSEAKIELGKTLFFDPILSANVERSCASCHKPEMAFTDGLEKSTALGFDGTVDRNAPTLVNAALSPRFFYDLRAQKLEAQFDHVIFNPLEFNSSYALITERLRGSDEYVKLFKSVYGENARINKRTIETAIGAYIVSLNSFDSEVDLWMRGEVEVSQEVENGFNLFMGKAACGTCHFAPTFSGLLPPYYQHMETEVLGVPVDTAYSALDPDLGRAMGLMKERSEIYNHSFKTVTVRNAELTAPYMHNGVFETLKEVVEFYNEGGGAGRNLDVPNQTLPFDELNLNDIEIAELVAFMRALNSLPETAVAPNSLPKFDSHPEWNDRVIGGEY